MKNPVLMSKKEVLIWLEKIAFGSKYKKHFEDNDIDVELLNELDDNILENVLNVKNKVLLYLFKSTIDSQKCFIEKNKTVVSKR